MAIPISTTVTQDAVLQQIQQAQDSQLRVTGVAAQQQAANTIVSVNRDESNATADLAKGVKL